jgi:mono/diheme cytochrome c family protein
MRVLMLVLATVLLLGLGGFAGWVYVASEASLHRRYPMPPDATLPTPEPGAVQRGERLSSILGCKHCHGDDLHGGPFPEPEPFAQVTAANLTRRTQTWTDADFARLIRHGLTPKGESARIMPAESYVRISDEELADLLAYLRSLPHAGGDPPTSTLNWRTRWALARGGFQPEVARVATALDHPSTDLGPQHAAARHLVDIACTECHGSDLKGDRSGKPPDLMIAGAYDPADFHRLLKTGVAARNRFSHFTDEEVEAIRLYLVARATAPNS